MPIGQRPVWKIPSKSSTAVPHVHGPESDGGDDEPEAVDEDGTEERA